jgi:hypothetical protein
MTQSGPGGDFDGLWRAFLAQLALARNLGRIAALYGSKRPQGGVADDLLAALFLHRLVTLLDAGLDRAAADRGLRPTARERRHGTAGSLARLVRHGVLDAQPALQALCLTSEAIAARPLCGLEWPILDQYIADVQVVLLHLGVLETNPNIAFYGHRTPTAADEPGMYMRYAVVFGVEDAGTHTPLVELNGSYSSPRG